jgi:hypothetical protein
MQLKCENFTITTGTTADCWPLVTNRLKAHSVILTATTGVPFYVGGSAMTLTNGFPVRGNPVTATSFDTTIDTTPASITLNGETLGWANAEISLNEIYVRTTTADQTIYGLYFRRKDEDD